jgi:hypothetical protein
MISFVIIALQLHTILSEIKSASFVSLLFYICFMVSEVETSRLLSTYYYFFLAAVLITL